MIAQYTLRSLMLVAGASLCTLVDAQEEKALRSSVAHVTRLAFTESLPEADRIELFTLTMDVENKLPPDEKPKPDQMSKEKFLLRSFDGSPLETENPYIDVEKHVTIKADRCKEIVSTWRKLKFRPNGAFCHAPPYGVRFYKDDVLIFETTICWKCHNFYIPDYDPETGEIKMVIYGFDDNANSKKLLSLFQRALPLKSKEKANK
jgi:hypothetical protein